MSQIETARLLEEITTARAKRTVAGEYITTRAVVLRKGANRVDRIARPESPRDTSIRFFDSLCN